jgi:hypothetical protein
MSLIFFLTMVAVIVNGVGKERSMSWWDDAFLWSTHEGLNKLTSKRSRLATPKLSTFHFLFPELDSSANDRNDGAVVMFACWAESVWTVFVIGDLDWPLAPSTLCLGGCKQDIVASNFILDVWIAAQAFLLAKLEGRVGGQSMLVRFGPQESAVLERTLQSNSHHLTTVPVAGFQRRMEPTVTTSSS